MRRKVPSYCSSDPLDLGEALWLAHWFPDEPWAQLVRRRSLIALEQLWAEGDFTDPLRRRRLAFREFGTTIGVQATPSAEEQWGPRVRGIHREWQQHLTMRDNDITPVRHLLVTAMRRLSPDCRSAALCQC